MAREIWRIDSMANRDKLRWLIGAMVCLFISSSVAARTPGPREVASRFFKGSDAVRSSAIMRYASQCKTRGRQQFQFRRYYSLREHFQKLLQDKSRDVRLAALSLGGCFHKASILADIGELVADPDPEVSLEAMTQLAHSENLKGVTPLSRWLLNNDRACLGTEAEITERCIFAAYALGQCGQSGLIGSRTRTQAAKIVQMFLLAEVPKLREVAAVALSFVGTVKEKPGLKDLLESEVLGRFKRLNSPEVIKHIRRIMNNLPKA